MNRKVLVTGAAGLIGEILLKNNTENNLFGLDIIPSLYSNHYATDISDPKELERIFKNNNIEVVVHLAGNPSVLATWDSLLINNINGTANIYEAAKNSGVKKVIFASSNHAVGLFENDKPYKQIVSGNYKGIKNYKLIRSNCEIRPDSLYGTSKAFGENIGRYYQENYGLNVACLRIGSVRKINTPVEQGNNRIFSTWCSHEDIYGLIDACIKSEDLKFNIFYGVSDNQWKIWDIMN